MRLCFKTTIGEYDIKLTQAANEFTVTYGLQERSRLPYHLAATELGSVIMHALACEGKVDNREAT